MAAKDNLILNESEIIKLYNKGLTVISLSVKFNVSRSSMVGFIKKLAEDKKIIKRSDNRGQHFKKAMK